MRRLWSTYRAWHKAQPARPATALAVNLRFLGYVAVFAFLMYVMMIRSNPEGVQYGTPEWCDSTAVECVDWSVGSDLR